VQNYANNGLVVNIVLISDDILTKKPGAKCNRAITIIKMYLQKLIWH